MRIRNHALPAAIGEQTDVAARFPDEVARLQRMAAAARGDTGNSGPACGRRGRDMPARAAISARRRLPRSIFSCNRGSDGFQSPALKIERQPGISVSGSLSESASKAHQHDPDTDPDTDPEHFHARGCATGPWITVPRQGGNRMPILKRLLNVLRFCAAWYVPAVSVSSRVTLRKRIGVSMSMAISIPWTKRSARLRPWP